MMFYFVKIGKQMEVSYTFPLSNMDRSTSPSHRRRKRGQEGGGQTPPPNKFGGGRNIPFAPHPKIHPHFPSMSK